MNSYFVLGGTGYIISNIYNDRGKTTFTVSQYYEITWSIFFLPLIILLSWGKEFIVGSGRIIIGKNDAVKVISQDPFISSALMRLM